ncbi:MAG: hypothetical protein WC761_07010 [Candidatus Paceibacterota bacterium]|jgi:hypothetical protein
MVKMSKRVHGRNQQSVDEHDHDDKGRQNDDETKKIILDMQRKVINAPVLNGGFDRLCMKIESIEATQHQISERVDAIHDAIFNPDEGLFSRIAKTKVEQLESVADVDKQLASLSMWKEIQDKNTEKDAESTEKVNDSLITQQQTLDELVKWKTTLSSAGKWFAAALIGASISLMFKLLYDTIIQHWK